jgi:hypothetical protein
MFTPPSVNQIAKAYQGNPAPLGQKVEADKQRNGGIPSDLRQLLALNDITQGRNAMGIQQALQIPTNMPTVAEDLQERARQALQARMMQQAQEEQSRSGQPNVVPLGTPRPPMQAQGLDSLESNVGEGYAEGGIVGFDDGGGVSDQQIKDWFAANQGASDTDIYSAMKQHKVGTDQLTKAMGFDPTEVSRRYDVQARADIFKPERSRSEQESMVNQFYQDKGLTPDQLGQTNFGYPVDTRESRSENRPFTNMYQDYQQDLANTGRYDAPAGSQFRAKAVYMPGSIGDRGSIKLIDSATGQELTNLGGANSIGNTRNAFDLMDKFAVDPASYRQAASQMYESMGKPEYMQDDYKYLTGYKPRDVAGATDAFLTKPLANATYADLKYNPEKDDKGKFSQDTRTNIDWLGSTQRLLMSKGMGASEATNYLHQLIPVSGLVDWAEISKSKDPVKAIIGTLNYFQSKKLTNRRFASGGLAALAKGRYLDGDTDGMADEISTTIDDDQEAALSHGEFVIPADVVSHLGNGNSDAGAKKLYQMMDRIREARTGTKEQGKKINPDKFMPGGLAASKYATGGSVQKFNTGGTPTASGGIPLDTSKTSTLSPWAGDYVTNMLGKTQALTNAPMQTYGGPLTAGASDLQQQGFAGISDIAKGGFNPTTFTSGTFDANAANKYMNPYLMASLNPQMEEARRQSQITQQGNAAKMTGAGAFGGSRSALMDAETQRSLGANMSNIVGTGLNTAYDKAMAQFNAEQNRGLDTQKATEASRQYSADFGLKSMNDLMQAGKTQRDIEAEGIAADKRQFDEQQARPYTNLEFQRKMLEGLPIGASTTSVNQDTLSKLQTDISGLAALYQKLANLGIKAPK